MPAGLICFLGWSPGAVTTAYHALNDHSQQYLGENVSPVTRLVTISTALPGDRNRTQRTLDFLRNYFRAIGLESTFYDNLALQSDDIWSLDDVDEVWDTVRLAIMELRSTLGRDARIFLSLAGGRRAMAAVGALAAQWEDVDGLLSVNVHRDLEMRGGIDQVENLLQAGGLQAPQLREILNPLGAGRFDLVSVVRLPYLGFAGYKDAIAAFVQHGVISPYVPDALFQSWVRIGAVRPDRTITDYGRQFFERICPAGAEPANPLAEFGMSLDGQVVDRDRFREALRRRVEATREDLHVEFKAMRLGRGLQQAGLEAISAFANSVGGLLVLGVADRNQPELEEHARKVREDIAENRANYENLLVLPSITEDVPATFFLRPSLTTSDLRCYHLPAEDLGLEGGEVLIFIVRPYVRLGVAGRFELCRVVHSPSGQAQVLLRDSRGRRPAQSWEIERYRQTGRRSWV